MAETLGSLMDKLSIKNIRLWHLDEAKGITEGYKEKKELVQKQRDRLILEIDEFVQAGLQGKVSLREEKVKLYNKPEDKGLFGYVSRIGEAMNQLALENIRLWHLEDDIREEGIADSRIADLKREIDRANQRRNDLIDKVDELFEKSLKN